MKIEYEIVNFLNENRNHLPFYHIPYLQPPEDGPSTNDEEEKENEDEKEKNEEEKGENKSKKDSRHSSGKSNKSKKDEVENQEDNKIIANEE